MKYDKNSATWHVKIRCFARRPSICLILHHRDTEGIFILFFLKLLLFFFIARPKD